MRSPSTPVSAKPRSFLVPFAPIAANGRLAPRPSSSPSGATT